MDDGWAETAKRPRRHLLHGEAAAGEDDGLRGERAVAAYLMQVTRLCGDISRIAGDIADIELALAAECRRLAERDAPRSAEHLAAAVEADRFAARKRAEQRRWQLP